MANDMIQDIADFHKKFGVAPVQFMNLSSPARTEIINLKLRHLKEELDEIAKAACENNPVEFIDGLVDLVYVAIGAAYLTDLPFDKVWAMVHEANMKKMRAERKEQSKRGSTFDIIKPAGWVKPDVEGAVLQHITREGL